MLRNGCAFRLEWPPFLGSGTMGLACSRTTGSVAAAENTVTTNDLPYLTVLTTTGWPPCATPGMGPYYRWLGFLGIRGRWDWMWDEVVQGIKMRCRCWDTDLQAYDVPANRNGASSLSLPGLPAGLALDLRRRSVSVMSRRKVTRLAVSIQAHVQALSCSVQ